MSELEFEIFITSKFLKMLESSLDSDYELLLNNLLNEYKDYTLNFNGYNDFISNLKLYIKKIQELDYLNSNIELIVKKYLNSDDNINDYFSKINNSILNLNIFIETINLSSEYNNFIIDKNNQFLTNFSQCVFNYINNKSYLLNSDKDKIDKILSDMFELYDKTKYIGLLNQIDSNSLSLLLNTKKYSVLPLIEDNVFLALSKDRIIDLLKNTDVFTFSFYSKEKIKYIIDVIGIKQLFEITDYLNYEWFYQVIDKIDDSLFEFIIENEKFEGIEKCKYVLNNEKYVKKLINNGYYTIFNYMNVNLIDDEILSKINCEACIMYNYSDSNLSELLLNNKIFLNFSKKLYNHRKLLNNIKEENITREMVLFCMLDGMKLENDMSNKIKQFYNRSIDDIKFAIEKGYKCSLKTIELTKEEIMLFINNGQLEVINYIKNPKLLTMDLIKIVIMMGYKIDTRLINFLKNNYDYKKILLELLNFSIDNNYENFYSSLLFIDENISNINKKLLEIYKDDDIIKSFLNFRINDYITYYSLKKSINITSIIDIRKYFNSVGISDNLYNEVLFIPQLLRNFVYNYNLCNHFKDDSIILNYIKFSVNRFQLNLKNKQEIYKYFNESGPNKNLYEFALFNNNLFYVLSNDYPKFYQDDLSILNYVKFKIKHGINLNSKGEIYKYFSKDGLTDDFYEDVLFGKQSNYLKLLINEYNMIDKYKDNQFIDFYIKFSLKYGSNIFEFINKNNVSEYFNNYGITDKLKQYMKDNNSYTKHLISVLAHNDKILNNVDNLFISIFESYIVDTYFKNNKNKYNYFLKKLGPSMLFHLDEENIKKLFNLNDFDLSLIFDTINSCKYDIVPSNIVFDNIIISLCDFVFKKEYDEIVNVASIIRNDLMKIEEDEIVYYFENDIMIKNIIQVTNCDKLKLLNALIECRNLHEDKLRIICRDYLIKCEKFFLEQNKDTILNKFGIKKIYDQKDALKKLGEYYKYNITFKEFKKYLQIFLNSCNNLDDNIFIESIKMTKLQLKSILSITNNDFNLICNSLRNNYKPDDLVKDKFRYFKMFLSAYTYYKYSNEEIDDILSKLNILTVCSIKLEDIDMFKILKGLDIDIFLNTVCDDKDILNNLKSVFQNKFLGRIPESIGDYLESQYQIKLPGGINNIGIFLTKYSQILKEEEKRLKNQGVKVENISDIKLSFVNVILAISNVNSEIKEIRRLIGKSVYNDFVRDPIRNSSLYSPDKRQNKLVILVDFLYTLDKITIPSKDIVISNNSKMINIIVGNRTNEANICHGERTGSCMRIGGIGEGLFLKCLTDKNWFHIRFEDPNTHEYISRVSGFRNGNTVYLNQLRDTSDDTKYSNKDLQEFIKVYAKSLIEDTKDSKFPIENVFINNGYAMENYKTDKIFDLGIVIKTGYNLDDVKDYRLRDSMDIWTDVSSNSILLATTEEGSKTKDGYAPLKNGIQNTELYDAVRDKIYGLFKDEITLSHRFITCCNKRLMEVINRVHAMKEKLLGKDYRYDIEDIILDESEIIDGYASSDFYVYIDSNYNIHSDYIKSIEKDSELIPYGQVDKAKEEMEKYTEILNSKYLEVKNVI